MLQQSPFICCCVLVPLFECPLPDKRVCLSCLSTAGVMIPANSLLVGKPFQKKKQLSFILIIFSSRPLSISARKHWLCIQFVLTADIS